MSDQDASRPKPPRFGVPIGGFALPNMVKPPPPQPAAAAPAPAPVEEVKQDEVPQSQSSVPPSYPPAGRAMSPVPPAGRAMSPLPPPVSAAHPPPLPAQPSSSASVPPALPPSAARAASPPPAAHHQPPPQQPNMQAFKPPPPTGPAPPPVAAATPAMPGGAPPAQAKGPPPLPPPQTDQEADVARSMLAFLLEELSPSVFTRKKDALDTFENYYFKIFPAYSAVEIKNLYYGSSTSSPGEKMKGLLALCGTTSWKHSGLKKAAAQALNLLAKLCDRESNPHAQGFLQLFVNQDIGMLKNLKIDKHISTSRGAKSAANFLLSLLKNFKHESFEALQRDFQANNSISNEELSQLKTMKKDMLAKRISMRSQDKDILKKKAAYGGGGLGTISEKAASSSSSSAGQKQEKQSIKNRLLAFFGARPSAADLEKKGLLRAKAYGVTLEEMYKNPSLLESAPTAFNNAVQVPAVLKQCCSFMVHNGIIQMQGVFRLSGDSIEINATKEKFDMGVQVDLTKVGPHSISGLVKLFLRNLPQPLLCFENYDEFVAAFRAGDMNKIDSIVAALPKPHWNTFVFLMDFLSQVNSFHETNMMTDTNISICIAPNILRPKVETYEKVAKDTPITIGVVKYLISQHAAKMKSQGLLQGGLAGAAPAAVAAPVPAAAAAAAAPAPVAAVAPVAAMAPISAAAPASVAAATSPAVAAAATPAAEPPKFMIAPASPRGQRVEEYSSTSAEAVAAAAAAAKAAEGTLDENGNLVEAPKPVFVPTTAQFDLANAMAAAMAGRSALKSTRPAGGASSAPAAAAAEPAAPVPSPFQLKKVGPPGGGVAGLKKVEPVTVSESSTSTSAAPGPRRPSLLAKSSANNVLSPGGGSAAAAGATIPEHFERFTDPTTKKHYYYNKLTQKVTWRKPDAFHDSLDTSDVKQMLPPPAPTEPPPADEEDESKGAEKPAAPIHSPVPHHSNSADSNELANIVELLPVIVPAPPKQPRRTSSMFPAGHQLLPPPPVPRESPAIVEEDDEAAASVPSSVPPEVPSTLPPAYDDGDDDFMMDNMDLPLPPPPMPSAPTPAEAPAPVPVPEPAAVPAPEPAPAVDNDLPPAPVPVVAAAPAPTPAPVPEPALPPAPVAAAAAPAPTPAPQPVVEAPKPAVVATPTPAAAAAAPAEVDDDDDVIDDEEWEEYTDAVSGKVYFFNKRTNTTTWTNPFKNAKPDAAASSAAVAPVPAGPSVPATATHSSSSFPSSLYGGWECVEIKGEWNKDSAQGCYPNFSGWSRNPQYHVGVAEAAADGKKQQVVIQLTWSGLSRVNGGADEDDSGDKHIAGFYVLVNHGPSYQKLFINPDEIVARSEFEKSGSVVVNLLLDASFSTKKPAPASEPYVQNYVIIPSTFEPGYTGSFTLTVHSAAKTWLQPVSPAERWVETAITSQWLGDTAGGCRNHAATFPNNPQFTLTSTVSTPTPVLVLLTQDVPAGSGTVHPIGWYAINQSGKIEAKGAFQGNVEVHNQFELNPASSPYIIVPCTFSPGLEAKFTLSVFSPPFAKIMLQTNVRA